MISNIDSINELANPSVTGDVIGDTAYSERFVLKILLKLSNLDSLKDEINEKSFEDDICTLWDMTVERDVVVFLMKHKVFNIFEFALPVIESPRFVEIIVGIVGNMCCEKEATEQLLGMNKFLFLLLEYIKTDDSPLLIQLLRLVSSSLSSTVSNNIPIWMNMFNKVDFSNCLYFILKNSSNKQLLVTALENFNTISSYCNIQRYRSQYFEYFVSKDALSSLTTAFSEIIIAQRDTFSTDELERIIVICLQMALDLVSFDDPIETFDDCIENVTIMISTVLKYYETKLVQEKEIDSDLVELLDCINTIIRTVSICENCNPEKYFDSCYRMWIAIKSITKVNQNGDRNFEEVDKEEFQDFVKNMRAPLSLVMCMYMETCQQEDLYKVLDTISNEYDDIMASLKDADVKLIVTNKTSDYRTRIKETVN